MAHGNRYLNLELSKCSELNSDSATDRAPGAPKTVIQVGPSLDETGGMATVCRLMAQLTFAGQFRVMHFATTRGLQERESLLARTARHVRHMRALRDCIGAHCAQVVHIHTCSGFSFFRSAMDAWAARKAGCRVVLHIHGAGFDRFCAESSVISRRIIRQTLEGADAVIALSCSWADALRSIAPRARIIVVENAVPGAALREASKVTQFCQFLLLARMDAWKGVDDLLAACTILKNRGTAFQVTLAGPAGSTESGPDLSRRIAAAGLADCVRYIGSVEGASKENLWRMTDVLVQPSHQEGMPMSMLEALMRGIPVVATRVGAIPEVITDGREGLLIAPRAVDELAMAMQKMIADEPARRAMGMAAGQLARRRFSRARFEQNLGQAYSNLQRGNGISQIMVRKLKKSANHGEHRVPHVVAASN